jgi:outer membrane protein OmpA-like peptidoglycan-associated protein
MRRLLPSLALLALLISTPATAKPCEAAFATPRPLDEGEAISLYQAGMRAMQADRMEEADRLLRSSFARISDLTGEGRPALEVQVMARLTEVAVQRKDLDSALFRMKVVQERAAQVPHPGWVDAVIRYADQATTALQDALAGSATFEACRSFGVAPRASVRVQFGTDSIALDEAARAQLSRVAANLVKSGAAKIIVRGHTDARGSDAYNDALSLRRATAVVAMLTALEPTLAGKVTPEGIGKREPLYPGDDEETYKLNRRVDIALNTP